MTPPVGLKKNEVAVSTKEIGGGSYTDPLGAAVGGAAVFGPIGLLLGPLAALSNEPDHMTPEANQRVVDTFGGPLSFRVGGGIGNTFTFNDGKAYQGQEVRFQLQLPPLNDTLKSDIERKEARIKSFTSVTKPYLRFNGMLRRNDEGPASFDLNARGLSVLRWAGTAHDARFEDGAGNSFYALSAPTMQYRVSLLELGARAERDSDGLGGQTYAGEIDWLNVSVGGQALPRMWLQADISAGLGVGHFQAMASEDQSSVAYSKLDARLSLTTKVGDFTLALYGKAAVQGTGLAGDPEYDDRAFRTQVGGGVELGRNYGRIQATVGAGYLHNTARVNDVKENNDQVSVNAAIHF